MATTLFLFSRDRIPMETSALVVLGVPDQRLAAHRPADILGADASVAGAIMIAVVVLATTGLLPLSVAVLCGQPARAAGTR